jgi:hypothetical protein
VNEHDVRATRARFGCRDPDDERIRPVHRNLLVERCDDEGLDACREIGLKDDEVLAAAARGTSAGGTGARSLKMDAKAMRR